MKKNTSSFLSLALLMPALILGLSGLASAVGYNPICDLIEDGHINNKDLGAFVDEWLNNCNSANNWCNGANFNNDNNMVGFDDYTLFANYYLADANFLGYWMFDEGSDNTAYDSSGNGNDGNLVGNTTWTTGHIGGALSFDGDGDYVDCGTDSSLNITDEITIAAWVKVSELEAVSKGLVSKWTTGDRSYGLFKDGNNKFAFCLTSTGSAPISKVASNSAANVNQWYHIAGVRRANTQYLYINSVEQTNTGFAGSIWPSATFLEIGAYEEGASSFNGAIDDVRIYGRGFDAAEVSQLYQDGLGYKAFNPDPCDEATGVNENNVVLSWSSGRDACSHDVYLGTDYNDVNDANNSWPVAAGPNDPNVYKGNQGLNSYDPCGLKVDITYHWRIDEVCPGGTTTGDVWSFTPSIYPDINDLKWLVVIDEPWDSPDRLNHFDNFIATNGAHPRLLLTQAKVDELKTKISSGIYANIWNVIENKADSYLISSPRNNPGNESDTRWDGDAVPWLAMAYLMTDNITYRNKAVSWMTTVCNYAEWDDNDSLGAGHCLMGVSLGYDWLYNHMTAGQRNIILNGSLGDRGLTYFADEMANEDPVHKERYLANHCQVEYGGLAAAGFALYGEVTDANDWLRKAYNIFNAAFRISGSDGGCTEGHQYYGLKTEFQMHFNKMAKELLGRDFYYESEWLKNIGYFILYSNLPDFSSGDNVMRFGDTTYYTYNGHGPIYQLFNVASEHGNPYFQWLALEMLNRGIGTTHRMGWSNLLWYDDTIASTSPSTGNLPTFRHFEDTGWVTNRSSWDANAVMVGFKCGPFHGHALQALYDRMSDFQDLSGGHGHPDVQHFNIYGYGQRLATDDGRSTPKWTYYHSTMLIGPGSDIASGQLGDTYTSDSYWFDREEVFNAGATSTIIKAESTTDYDYIIGDAENIYRDSSLSKFLRHFIYIKPDIIVIVDELESSSSASDYYQWRMRYEGSISGSGDYYTVSNSNARMDTHFAHTQSISTSISGTYLLAEFDSTGSDLLVTILHPRRNTDPACTIGSSIAGSDIELTITTGSGTINVDVDLAAQEVTID